MTIDNRGNWFDEDPEWDDLRQRVNGQPIAKRPPKPPEQPPTETSEGTKLETSKKVDISLHLSLPKFKIKRPNIPRRHLRLIGIGVFTLVVVGAIGYKSIFGNEPTTKDANAVLSEVSSSPEFDTILPDGKEDTASQKVAYDPEKHVASYTDKQFGANLTISQQPLPESFKDDPDKKVAILATEFSATDEITTSSPKAYLGTSAKGPQTVIFHKNGVLVFILSDQTLRKDEWAPYITNLR